MFCTNCGQEMRTTDKFCAECGAAAAPRPNRQAQPAADPAPAPPFGPSGEIRTVHSTIDAFHSSLTPVAGAVAASPVQPPSPRAEESAPVGIPREDPALSFYVDLPKTQVPAKVVAQSSSKPNDARAESVPASTYSSVGTVGCPECGRLNPEGNRFCETCGKPLAAHPAEPVEFITGEAPPSWLSESQPPTAHNTAPEPTPLAPAAVVEAEPTAGGFSYYYDDRAAQPKSSRFLLIAAVALLAIGIIGVLYLMMRGPAKNAANANVTVTIAPTEAQVVAGNAHDFSATVSGASQTDVTWSVQEGSAGGSVVNHGAQADNGVVSMMVVYIAPSTPGTYHLLATSTANPKKSATAEITVTAQ